MIRAAATFSGRLAGKVAVVTGGGTGIGQGIAKTLAADGAHVVICGRREKPLQETCEMIGPAQCSYLQADVSTTEGANNLIKNVLETRDRIDILVNNAGTDGGEPDIIEQTAVEDYEKIMDINLKSQFLLCQAVLPHMKKRSATLMNQHNTFELASAARPHAGAIINLSSIAGQKGFPTLSAYSASNFARWGLTRTLAGELAPFHITCNAVAPGIVWTAIWDRLAAKYASDEGGEDKMKTFQDKVEALIPMKTAQLPEDIGEACLYFATAPNSTGQILSVDGGYLA